MKTNRFQAGELAARKQLKNVAREQSAEKFSYQPPAPTGAAVIGIIGCNFESTDSNEESI
jgi:hypothetical protein